MALYLIQLSKLKRPICLAILALYGSGQTNPVQHQLEDSSGWISGRMKRPPSNNVLTTSPAASHFLWPPTMSQVLSTTRRRATEKDGHSI